MFSESKSKPASIFSSDSSQANSNYDMSILFGVVFAFIVLIGLSTQIEFGGGFNKSFNKSKMTKKENTNVSNEETIIDDYEYSPTADGERYIW